VGCNKSSPCCQGVRFGKTDSLAAGWGSAVSGPRWICKPERAATSCRHSTDANLGGFKNLGHLIRTRGGGGARSRDWESIRWGGFAIGPQLQAVSSSCQREGCESSVWCTVSSSIRLGFESSRDGGACSVVSSCQCQQSAWDPGVVAMVSWCAAGISSHWAPWRCRFGPCPSLICVCVHG
jgi:hypothetical protein